MGSETHKTKLCNFKFSPRRRAILEAAVASGDYQNMTEVVESQLERIEAEKGYLHRIMVTA